MEARFWAKVNKTESCWLWMAKCSYKGYGYFWLDGRMQYAHRVVWTLVNGSIPDKLHVLHTCDTPACVNPAHLFLGTNADNVADREAKGRTVRGDQAGARTKPESWTAASRHATGNRKTSLTQSKYRGVTWLARLKKWRAKIRINKKDVHLGLFINEEEASHAYQKALQEATNGPV
jgi:hypothetical protein